jgi:DNA-binding NtrC family response regulator
MATSSDAERIPNLGKVILVGSEDETILEKRLRAAGCEVVTVTDGKTAFERVHREPFDGAVLVSRGLLINVTETIFNLRDINPSMEIIVLWTVFRVFEPFSQTASQSSIPERSADATAIQAQLRELSTVSRNKVVTAHSLTTVRGKRGTEMAEQRAAYGGEKSKGSAVCRN